MTGGMTTKSGHSDFEAIFKQHVHSNIVLHSRMQGMDSLKRKKFQELERQKYLFRMQYSKYNNGLHNVSSVKVNKTNIKAAVPKPVFVVCKGFPYSLKTWHTITDVSDGSLDLYKTDVLQTEEKPVSFRTRSISDVSDNSTERRCSTSQNVIKNSEDEVLPRLRRRSHTMSEIEEVRGKLQNKGSLPVRKVDSDGDINSTKQIPIVIEKIDKIDSARCKSTGANQKDTLVLPEIQVSRKTPSPSYASKCDNCAEQIRFRNRLNSDVSDLIALKHLEQDSLLSVNPSPALKRKTSTSGQTEGTSTDIDRERSASLKKSPGQKDSPTSILSASRKNSDVEAPVSMRRQSSSFAEDISENKPEMRMRSLTMESGRRPSLKNIERRNSRKYEIGLEGYSGYRKASLFEKMLSASCSSLSNRSDGSDDDLRTCRYLRINGENINGSKEDVSLESIDFRHTTTPVTEETASTSEN